jgi:hypothetical protein
VGIIALVAAAIYIGIFVKWRDCERAGGVLVRGLFGYECIEIRGAPVGHATDPKSADR